MAKAEVNILDSKPGTTFKFFFENENETFRFSEGMPFGNTNNVINEQYLEAAEGMADLLTQSSP